MELTTTVGAPPAAPRLNDSPLPTVRIEPLRDEHSGDVYGTAFRCGTGDSEVKISFEDRPNFPPVVNVLEWAEYTIEEIEQVLPSLIAIFNDPRVKAARRRAAAGLPPLLVDEGTVQR